MTSIPAKGFQDQFFCRNPGLRQPLQLMKAVPDASFFVKDTHYRYVMVNDFHLAIYGLAREEDLVGLSKHRSRNKWRKLPACDAMIYRKLEAYATEKPDSDFSNGAKLPALRVRTGSPLKERRQVAPSFAGPSSSFLRIL